MLQHHKFSCHYVPQFNSIIYQTEGFVQLNVVAGCRQPNLEPTALQQKNALLAVLQRSVVNVKMNWMNRKSQGGDI